MDAWEDTRRGLVKFEQFAVLFIQELKRCNEFYILILSVPNYPATRNVCLF